MKSERKLTLFLMLLLITISFNSCTDKVEEKSPQSEEITFWHFWSEPYQRQVMDSIITEFTAETGIKVKTTELSWNDGKTKLFAAFNSGTAPDVLELGSDWVAQFSSTGVLKSITAEESNLDRFIPFSKQPAIWDGEVYALPWVVDTRVLFVNNEFLRKLKIDFANESKTYDNLNRIAESVNGLSDEIYGFGVNGPDRHRLYKKLLISFWSFGGEVFDSNGKLVINSPENVRALDAYLKSSRTGLIESQRQLDNLFTRGKIGFWISGGWLIKKIKNENPQLDYTMHLVPGGNSEQGTSFAGGEYLSISSKSKNQAAALKFVNYMTKGENALKFTSKIYEAGYPADKDYYNQSYSDMPERKIFAEQLDFAKVTPVQPKWLEIEEIIEDEAAQAIYGKKSAAEALKDAEKKINLLLEESN